MWVVFVGGMRNVFVSIYYPVQYVYVQLNHWDTTTNTGRVIASVNPSNLDLVFSFINPNHKNRRHKIDGNHLRNEQSGPENLTKTR